jgi:broad specificity phosphatase PhoE
LILVRHGQTAWHAESRHVGNADIPLDDTGKEQARRVAEHLAGTDIDAAFSSPLSRCLETARLVAEPHGLPVVTDGRLREMDMGEWSGETYEAVAEKYGDIISCWTRDPGSLTPPGGEALEKVRERTLSWLEEAWEDYRWKNLLVSSHSTPIRVIVSDLIGIPFNRMFCLSLAPASITTITYNGELANLEVLNDTCHLAGRG